MRATSMTSFNDARKALLDHCQGLNGPAEVAPLLEAYLAEGRQAHHVFLSEIRFQEDTPELKRYGNEALLCFSALEDLDGRLREAFEEGMLPLIPILLERLARRLDRLHDALRFLREMERPVFSPSPFVSEIIRCGLLVLDGKLAPMLLQERLNGFILHFHGFLGQFALKESLEPLVERLSQAGFELESLLGAEELNEGRMRELLEELREATDLIYEASRAPEGGEQRPCPRCGASNPVASRVCSGCQGQLPAWNGDLPETQLDLHEDEGGSSLPSHMRFLLEQVERVAEGDDPGPLRAELARQQGRLQQLETWLAAHEAPSGDDAGFQRIRAGLQEALLHLRAYYEELEACLADLNPAELIRLRRELEPVAWRLAELQAGGLGWIREARAN